MSETKIATPKTIHHSHQLKEQDLWDTIILYADDRPGASIGKIYNAGDRLRVDTRSDEEIKVVAIATADRIVRAYNCHDALIEALQSLVDVAPSEGHRCLYCNESVYGTNDTAEHSHDCELAKAQDILDRAKPKAKGGMA